MGQNHLRQQRGTDLGNYSFPRSLRFQDTSYLHAQLIEDKTSRVVKETMPFPAEFYNAVSVVMRYCWANTNRKAVPQPRDLTGKLGVLQRKSKDYEIEKATEEMLSGF